MSIYFFCSIYFSTPRFAKPIEFRIPDETSNIRGWGFPSRGFLVTDLVIIENKIIKKLSFETKFPYINLICGYTSGSNYEDYSMGLKIDIMDWSFVYATLQHDNDILGTPTSIELIRKF